MATRAGSGELAGSMPNSKRKSPQAGGGGAAEPPAPPRPTCSSPAIAHGWALLSCEPGSCDATCESAREPKALRICAASAAEPAQAASHEAPAGCGASGMHAVCSMPAATPLAMLHSYHAGCCIRLGSSSSLSELDSVAAVAAADDATHALPAAEADDSQQAAAAQQQQQQQQPGLCDPNDPGMRYTAAAGGEDAVPDMPPPSAAAAAVPRAAAAASPSPPSGGAAPSPSPP